MTWRFRVFEVALTIGLAATVASGWWTWSMAALIVVSFAVCFPIIWFFFPVYFGLKERPPEH